MILGSVLIAIFDNAVSALLEAKKTGSIDFVDPACHAVQCRMPLDTAHLFTGPNAYLLTEELQRWKRAFASKHGTENMLELDAKSCSQSELLDATMTMPFLSEKRLVILSGVPKMEKEDLVQLLSDMHPQVILLIIEPSLDKRLSVSKHLLQVATVHDFAELHPAAMSGWVRSYAKTHGREMGSDAVKELLLIVGSDQQMLSMELRKLIAYTTENITAQDVQDMAVPAGSQVVWRLTDLLGSRKIDEALQFVRSSLERGEDPYALWAILLNMIKNVVLVAASLQSGLSDDKSIAAETGMHFFAVRGLKDLARSMNLSQVRKLATAALESDIALKTGGHRYTAERPEELIALLERTMLLTKV